MGDEQHELYAHDGVSHQRVASVRVSVRGRENPRVQMMPLGSEKPIKLSFAEGAQSTSLVPGAGGPVRIEFHRMSGDNHVFRVAGIVKEGEGSRRVHATVDIDPGAILRGVRARGFTRETFGRTHSIKSSIKRTRRRGERGR